MSEYIEPVVSNGAVQQRTLSSSSLSAIRSWLQSQRNTYLSGKNLRSDDVRRAMRLVCEDVRKRGVPVERLIIMLKQQWSTLTEDGESASAHSRDALDQIIRTCIEEFYAAAPQRRAPSDGDSSHARV